MKIGRNEPCPCGSGKKYKKCCLNKPKENIKDFIGDIDLSDIFESHNDYIHNRKVKNPEINEKLLNIYDNSDSLSAKEIIDGYLDVMNYVLDYATEKDIHTIKELDEEDLVGDFLINIIGDFEMEIFNLDKEDYDLNITNQYFDRLITVLDLDYDNYESSLRGKTHNLFRLGKIEDGEKLMLDLIDEKHNSIYPFVELVDDFVMIGDLNKAKYYYDLGMKNTGFADLDILAERSGDFK